MKNKILLIDNSAALIASLSLRLQAELNVEIVSATHFTEVQAHLAGDDLAFAITGSSLPDASFEDILQALADARVPAIVLTGTHDGYVEKNLARFGLIEYVVKADRQSFDTVLRAARRAYENQKIGILVVDDARSARSKIANLLKKQNFTVYQARSGKNAMALLARHPGIRLLITDYLMPDMDGYELVKRVRRERDSEQLRIIGISGSSDRHLSAQFLQAGASDFIHSPFIPEELKCRIDNNVETLRQLDALRNQAQSDPLTGIANRRHFFERGQRQLADCITAGRPAAVALIDIDHFKQVNDVHGHAMGDQVLTQVARLMQRKASATGQLAARYGGEEFCLFLSDIDVGAANAFCEDLRRSVEALEIGFPARPVKVTVSIGLCQGRIGSTFDALLQSADALLYQAKNQGRNRVVCSLAPPEILTIGDTNSTFESRSQHALNSNIRFENVSAIL